MSARAHLIALRGLESVRGGGARWTTPRGLERRCRGGDWSTALRGLEPGRAHPTGCVNAHSTVPGTGCGGAIDNAAAIPTIGGACSTARADEDSDESFTLKSRTKFSSKQKAWWSAEPLRWVSDESSKIAGKKRAESENDDDAFTPWKSNNNTLTGDSPTPVCALTSFESRPSLVYTSPLMSASNYGKDNDNGDNVPGPQTVKEAVDADGVVGVTAAGGDESRQS